MKIRQLFIGFLFLCFAAIELPSVCADNVYRINTRTYRHMMNTNAHAYRHMMYSKYPSQFGQRFWGFVDNRVLQPEGPVDQLIQRLLQRVAAADQQNESASFLIAKKTAAPDADLSSTLGKTQDILKTLGLEEPKPVDAVTPPISGKKDFSRFDELVP